MNVKNCILIILFLLVAQQGNAKRHHNFSLIKNDTTQTPVKLKLLVLRQGQLVHKYKQVIDTFEQRLTSIGQNLPSPIAHETPQILDINAAVESDTNQLKKVI